MRLCIHTDANNTFWAASVTHCVTAELEKPTEQQQHEPLTFLRAAFSKEQEHLSTYEQEAYAVVSTF